MNTDIIKCSDSVSEMKALPDCCVDLIFADPPYWMRTEGVLVRTEGTEFDGCDDDWDQFETLGDYEEFTRTWLKECRRILKDDGSIWVIGSMQCIYTIGAIMQDLGFWIINDIVWHKTNPTPNFMGTRLNNSHETLIWATKGKKSKYCFHYKTAKELNHDNVSDTEFDSGKRKQMGSVWRIPVCQGSERLKNEEGDKLHSTQKPEALLYRIIAISSDEGDVVLDPFGGTFTTAAMAKRLGRHYISYDRDQAYCEAGQARVDAENYVPDDISRTTADIKPLKAPMPDMIADGYFTAGEDFYLKGQDKASAKLRSDGKLEWGGNITDMHSCAAKIKGVKAKRLNGFDWWQVKRNGKLVSISEIRENWRADRELSNLSPDEQ